MPRASQPRKARVAKNRKPTSREAAAPSKSKSKSSQHGKAGKAPSRAAPRSRTAALPAPPPLTEPWHSRWLTRITRLAHIPSAVYLLVAVLLSLVLVPSVNWIYQVVRKPSELFFPVSDDLYKTPSETWASYGPLFLAHSTAIMTPELLAALAQKEASGNPVARTYWRWATTLNLFEIYRPASSAVGMYQFTDGTFEEARHYCIHDHRVVADGPWHDFESCWFNRFYARVIPSHAVELASSNLDRRVREILARQRIRNATLRQQQELAIITHLCGAGAAKRVAAQGLRLAAGQRCGDHDPRQYVERVMGLTRVFARLRQ